MENWAIMGEKQKTISESKQIEFLLNLGCSLSQARVYLALARTDDLSINSLSKATGIHRENLYKIVNSMVAQGLIEKEISSPVKYLIVPPEEVLPMLVTYKQTQISKLSIEAQSVIESLKNSGASHVPLFESQHSQFLVVCGRNITIRRIKTALSKTQLSIETITTQKRFSQALVEFGDLYDQALKRGVRIRLLTEEHVPDKEEEAILRRLGRRVGFEVKSLCWSIPAVAAIFDGKEAHVSLSVTAKLSEGEGLWSNNSCLVSLAKVYFEEKWSKSHIIP
jgi:sugar-specific transcriptional regulator TrmB